MIDNILVTYPKSPLWRKIASPKTPSCCEKNWSIYAGDDTQGTHLTPFPKQQQRHPHEAHI